MATTDSNPSLVPPIFCWTKMGVEAGQTLNSILSRKELERSAGNGIFSWGIGNSLGEKPLLARKVSPTGDIDVLFSQMKSPAKIVDINPSEVLLWLHYYDGEKEVTLPSHMVITSRGNSTGERKKTTHYALFCRSDRSITEIESHETIDITRARNFGSLNPLGASQVTALVDYASHANNASEKLYKVAFRAQLHGVGFVRLTAPVKLDEDLLAAYKHLCDSKCISEWNTRTMLLKKKALQKRTLPSAPRQRFLFEDSATCDHEMAAI